LRVQAVRTDFFLTHLFLYPGVNTCIVEVRLTKEDVDQLRKVFREEVEAEAKLTREELQSDILHTKLRIEEGLHTIENRLKNVEIKVNKIDKTVDVMRRLLDQEQMNQRERSDQVEEHLTLDTFLKYHH